MAANSPVSGPTTVTTSNDTGSIPRGRGGITGDRYGAPDTRFGTFLADEFRALESTLESQAATFVGTGNLRWHAGEWPADATNKSHKWYKVTPDDLKDKRVYKGHAYTDRTGCPRRRLRTQPYPSGETSIFDDLAIIKDEYNVWVARRKAEAGILTEAERQHLEADRAERRAKAEREQAERAAARKAADEETKRREAEEAERKAQQLAAAIKRWHMLPQATSHPYLQRKGLEGHLWHDVRSDGNKLAIAVRSVLSDEVVGIQYVAANGSKWFEEGTPKKDACIWVSGIPPRSANRFAEAEGWSSAASCALALAGQKPKVYVVAAIDAGNLEGVYALIKQRWARARITLASDDDAATALEIDKSGKPKPNTGQSKAHTLALKVGCKVAIPSIPDRPGTNVDFNDVFLRCGLETVRQQLLAARNPDPTFALADRVGKGLGRGYGIAKKYGCTPTVNDGRYLELPNIQPGVTVLRAAMGTGKTEAVARWLEQHPELSVLALSHLRGLTGNLAARLNLVDYRKISDGLEHKHRRSAFCLNSLWRLVEAETRKVLPADVVFADEIKQVLHRLTSRSDFARKRWCIAVLEHLVRSAKYVIVADAHVDTTTMNWLRRLRPQDAPQMVLSSYTPGSGRQFFQYERRGDVRAKARDALAAGKHVYYALNGLERAHEVSGWLSELKAELPELRTLLVCSETAGEKEVQAFFADPSGESYKYDLIVASPSVSTGVSIDGGHFDLVFGEFSARVGTPNDALQALARVRGAPELHVWVDARRAAHLTDRDTIRAGFWTEPGDDAQMADAVDFETGEIRVEAGYAELYLDVKVAEAFATNAYAKHFWTLVIEDGYTVRYGAWADDAKQIEQHARQVAKDAHKAALLGARDLDEVEARALQSARTQQRLTREDGAALERYELVDFYRLTDPATELPDLIDADRDGDLRRQIRHLELAGTDSAAVEAMMQEQIDRDTLRPDIIRFDHQHRAYSTTLAAAGIDPETFAASEKRYTAAELRETWLEPLAAQWRIYRRTVPSWPTLEYAQAQPLKALGGVLRGAFGLNQRRIGKAAKGCRTVSASPLAVRQQWLDRRKAKTQKREQISLYIKDITVASVPSPAFVVLPKPERSAVPEVPVVDNRKAIGKGVHFSQIPGYEVLRWLAWNQDDGPKRKQLLEYFGRSDSCDHEAREALLDYLAKPDVQQLLTGAA